MLWILIVLLLVIALVGVPVLHSAWSLLLLILVVILIVAALNSARGGGV